MNLARLLRPRSVAVVGASTRPGSYGNLAVANLVTAGFPGPVFGVHPTAAEVHGVPCVPRIADLPLAPDAAVIATPAATVPGLVAEAGARGCGGAVVFAAGFAETSTPGGVRLQEELVAAAARYDMPVCGPNGNGIVAVAARAPLWGDAYVTRRPGGVALVSQSGNVAVNALLSARGLRLHTVVSCGNQAVAGAADYLAALAASDGVRAVGLYLEDAGDGRRLAEALAACADRGVGVAVLQGGSSALGAASAAAHTGAVAGDARVLRALVEEAGGAWAHNPHELLELAKTLACAAPPGPTGIAGSGTPAWGRPPESEREAPVVDQVPEAEHGVRVTGQVPGAERGVAVSERRGPEVGVLVVTCSGGDAAVAADEAARHGVPLATLSEATRVALQNLLPETATPGNPLDYTAVIFGDAARTAALITVAAGDPSVGPVLVCHDRPASVPEGAAAEWDGALEGIISAAEALPGRLVVASTLPELMPEEVAERLTGHGAAPVAGLTEGVRCAGALLRRTAGGERLREIAAAATRAGSAAGSRPAEHEAKALARSYGIPVPAGRTARTPDEAVAVAAALGVPVAVKLSGPDIGHKADIGAVVLDVRRPEDVRAAADRLLGLPVEGMLLVEEMAPPGVEMMVAVRRDGVVPVLVVAMGGTWVEVLDDTVLLPLPVTPEQVVAAVRRLRGAALLNGGRGRPPVPLAAFAALATRAAALAREEDLALLEFNPVIVGPGGTTAVDAVVARVGA
ncbi:acetate--CoA ligase family protein [Sphaerisporangium rubeum]|uniref:Acetyl-CoA synthetase n=1 Tax=Sphaerisporangium rubeum TaxID=321317 RepID=A0A7X0ID97_9ACTN|nr:acetyl-CoA synthetase [Sphaerisporangium rubeum]